MARPIHHHHRAACGTGHNGQLVFDSNLKLEQLFERFSSVPDCEETGAALIRRLQQKEGVIMHNLWNEM